MSNKVMAKVLVVDDDLLIRKIVKNVLEAANLQVETVENADSALRMLEQMEGISLILTDIYMPDTDGLEFIRVIRKKFPLVRVIAMSGGDSTGYKETLNDATRFGAVATLEKPFEFNELQILVKRTIES